MAEHKPDKCDEEAFLQDAINPFAGRTTCVAEETSRQRAPEVIGGRVHGK